jgi:hypothetical protein
MAYIVWQLILTDQISNFSSSHSNDLNALATDIEIKLSVGNSGTLTPSEPSYDAPDHPNYMWWMCEI